MAIGRTKLGRNEITWLVDGAGGHGDRPLGPEAVVRSLAGRFRFVAAGAGTLGLRPPQLGALHAILAARTTEANEAVTVVMPTVSARADEVENADVDDTTRMPAPEVPSLLSVIRIDSASALLSS